MVDNGVHNYVSRRKRDKREGVVLLGLDGLRVAKKVFRATPVLSKLGSLWLRRDKLRSTQERIYSPKQWWLDNAIDMLDSSAFS